MIRHGEGISNCQSLGLAVGSNENWGQGMMGVIRLWWWLHNSIHLRTLHEKEWILLYVNLKINLLKSNLPSIIYLTSIFIKKKKKLNKKQIKSSTILILLDLTCHCWPTTPSCLSFLKPYFHFLLLKFLCSFQYLWKLVGPQEMDLGHNFISLHICPQIDNLLTWFTFTQTLLFWAPDPYIQLPTWHFHLLICLSKK